MTEVVLAEEFIKQYRDLPLVIKLKAEKQERLFRIDPFYPSLHTEKIEPKGRQIWTFRVDRSYRVAFRFLSGSKVLFMAIGPHDWIYRLRF